MYSVIKTVGDLSGNMYEFRGLSADTKPIGYDEHGRKVGNGSIFFEMDTSKQYMYDENGRTWVALSVII